jgi:hypothetical protein
MRRALENRLHEIDDHLERLQLLLMVREPATGLAANAYEGLRKAVVASAADRTAHLSQLARLDYEVGRGASPEAIAMLLQDLLAEAGLTRLTEPADGAFEVVDGDGDQLEIIEPAYVELETRRIVRAGKAKAVRGTDHAGLTTGSTMEGER